ncbi:MAG: vWA domain-containing protein [Mariniblastus sp.]
MSFRSLRRWWQIKTGKADMPIDGEVPFWVVSLAFHLLVIVFLARIIMPSEDDNNVALVLDEPAQIIEEDIDVSPEIEFDDVITEDIGADGEDGFEAAAAEAPMLDIMSEDPVDLEMEERELGEMITDNDFFEATAENMSPIAVNGSVGESVKAASGAIDRMTQQLLTSMEDRDTVVVWMFDQSASLMKQREEILVRFDRIYAELGLLEEAGHRVFSNRETDEPLITQVYAFGAKVSPMMRTPTQSVSEIKKAVRAIKRDESGYEYVMNAVMTAAKSCQKYREIDRATGQPKKNVMIIVVSDEAGDDVEKVDDAIRTCNKLQIPVYVVGVPAPFGRPETKVKWVDPDPKYDQSPQWAIVSQGPESVAPERLRLDFTGTFDDLDMIDSGFGPFHLTRLAYETSGTYFAVHPNRTTKRRGKMWETKSYASHLQYCFDPDKMRRYKPDYVSNKAYFNRLKQNKARSALVRAATYTNTGTLETPVLRFEKLNEARFVNEVSVAQRSAAIIEPKINDLYEMLKAGEEDRPKEISPRWKAGFDLAIGRAIAAKVRGETYNSMLALIKTKLKFDPPKGNKPQNNTWVLRPADAIETGSQDAKLMKKAKMYLERVVEEHPGTPWAMLAERELKTPIGWKWTQTYTKPPEPPKPRMQNNNPPPRRPNVPQPRENAMPKVKRPPPRL